MDIYPAYLGRIHVAIMHRLIIAPGVFFAAFGGGFLGMLEVGARKAAFEVEEYGSG
ncbi:MULTISPECIES: hypothetical protein [Xanthomonas]|uniref:hypothetical protein n=1 Tax=Xanthomonas TaxID=338 RepID=UPI00158E4395|nr:hypothetical protein [Xanthomonas campestris]MCC5094724.1 hypothetical protein [Xanthomonas campestris pv. incanae]MEA9612695.1 hypothetical protein [Xanthomonas campestris pv. incanae]WDJ11345.1 hypothetical protein JH299_07560 [Xanthomonas campestris pv. incanae]